MNTSILLAGATILVFLFYFFYKNGNARYYLLFVIYVLPLMELKVTPFDLGNLHVFDIITLFTFFLIPKALFGGLRFLHFYFILFSLFVSSLLASSILSDSPGRSILSLFGVVTPFIFAKFLFNEIKKDTDLIKVIITGLKLSCFIALTFMALQFFTDARFTFYDSLNQNVMGDEEVRYPGFFMDSQLNGIFLGMISFIWLLNFTRPNTLSVSNLLGFTIVLAGVIFTGSRSPMLGVLSALFFLVIFFSGKSRLRLLQYSFFGIIVVFIAVSTSGVFNRFKTLDDSYDFRQNIWQGAYNIFEEHPMFGIGTNNYKDYVTKHSQDQYLLLDHDEILYLDQPENTYLKLLVEWGAIAFVFLFVILLTVLFNFFFYPYKRIYNQKVSIFVAVILCWLISSMSVYTLGDSRIIILLVTTLVLTAFNTKKEIAFNDNR